MHNFDQKFFSTSFLRDMTTWAYILNPWTVYSELKRALCNATTDTVNGMFINEINLPDQLAHSHFNDLWVDNLSEPFQEAMDVQERDGLRCEVILNER